MQSAGMRPVTRATDGHGAGLNGVSVTDIDIEVQTASKTARRTDTTLGRIPVEAAGLWAVDSHHASCEVPARMPLHTTLASLRRGHSEHADDEWRDE